MDVIESHLKKVEDVIIELGGIVKKDIESLNQASERYNRLPKLSPDSRPAERAKIWLDRAAAVKAQNDASGQILNRFKDATQEILQLIEFNTFDDLKTETKVELEGLLRGLLEHRDMLSESIVMSEDSWLREVERTTGEYPEVLREATLERLNLTESEIASFTRYRLYVTLLIRNVERLLRE